MSLRDRLRTLQKLAADRMGIGRPKPLPEVVVCDDAGQVDKHLARVRAELGAPEDWAPLVVVEGPERVEPPADLPRD